MLVSASNRHNVDFHIKTSDLNNFVFEGIKMTLIHFTIALGMVLKTLVDATCLHAVITHVLRQQI